MVAALEEGPNPELIDMTRRFWIGAGARRCRCSCWRWRDMVLGAGPRRASSTCGSSNWLGLALRDAGRLLGGLAVLRARLGVGRQSQPEHVHAHRAGRRRGLRLQRCGDDRAADLSRRLPVHGVVETYFDTAVVITVLVLLGQVLELRARGRTSAAIKAAARPRAADGAA